MRIITSTSWKRIGNVHYYPFVSYVVSEQEANYIVSAENRKRYSGMEETYADLRISTFQNYEKRYGGQDANGKTILLYRHAAVGDSLIATSIPRYIKSVYPSASIVVYCHPTALDYWRSNLFIERGMAIPIPINFEAAKFFDYHIMYEGMAESNTEPNQGSGYDALFRFCGLNPPSHYKRPYVFIRPDDYEMVPMFKKDYGLNLEEPYLLYHLNPANHNRAYPFNLTMEFWSLFLNAYPKWKIVVVGLDEFRDPVSGELHSQIRKPMFNGFPANRLINLLSKTSRFRQLIPLVEKANIIVCPDSSVGHMAACFPHVPVVSLWGLIPPSLWTQDYPNHYPLWPHHVCDVCPCHNHDFVIPRELCESHADTTFVKKLSEGAKEIEWCAVLAAIKPEEILSSVTSLIDGNYSDQHEVYMAKSEGPPRVSGSSELAIKVEK